uniref:F21H2.5 n=2 Tax=Arabidopsis thaliana TaxID=3702 RepID=Q9S9Z6_ARATH|nr:F21H2.5 [Arabidopsis thaliana]
MAGNKANDEVPRKQHGPGKEKRVLRVSPRRKRSATKVTEELGSPSVAPTEDLTVEELPPRLFALDRYPSETKMNAYSKPEYISDLAKVLKGKPEMQFLLDSPFGKLFKIPKNKASFNAKLVLGLICRQLVTKKVNEMWIVFGGHPIRFGLREFSILTGLECGKYPKKKDVDDVISVKPECESVWKTLFGERFGDTVPTIADLVSWLQEEESMEGNPNMPTSKTVEMTKNLEFFCKYPWGRVSFTRTLGRIANFQTPYDAQKLIRGILVGSYALHGFPLALQLLAFKTIPSIAKLGPDDVPNRTFAERSIHRLASLRAIRTCRILECEAADEVEVNYIVKPADNVCPPSLSWDDEVDDPRVDYIEALLIDGHQWQEDEWVGGYARVPKQSRPPQLEETDVKRKRNAPGPSPKEPAMKKQKSEMDCDKEETAEDCFGEPVPERFIVEMRRSLKELEDQMYQMHEDMKDFVRDQIRAALDPKGKRPEQTIPSHDSREPPTSMDKAPVTAKKPSRRMSTKGSTGTRKSSRLTRVSHDVDTPALSVGCNSKEEDLDVPGVHTTAFGGRRKPSKPKKNDGANNESDFTTNDGLNSSAAEEEILDTGFLIVPYAGSTQSHLDRGNVVVGKTVFLGSMSGTVFVTQEERPVEEATVDTEMEEVPSNVSARVSEVDLLDNGPKDVAEPGLVGTHTGADEIADADIEMVDNPSGLPSTSAQDEARDASASTEANGSKSEETYEPSDGDTAHVIRELDTKAVGDLAAATDLEVVMEEPCIVEGSVETEDPNPGSDEADKTDIPKNNDESDNAAAVEAKEEKKSSPKVPKKVKKQLVYEQDDAHPHGFKAKTVLVPDVPAQQIEVVIRAGNVSYNPLDMVDPSKVEEFSNIIKGPSVIHTLFGFPKVPNDFFANLLTPGEWVESTHLEMMAMLMWHKNGEQMIANRCIVLDMMLTHLLTKRVGDFKKCINKNGFKWGKLLSDIANGVHINREPNMKWMKDVDVVFAPMNWKSEHWVALGINLNERLITVYDALISHTRESAVKARMTPICEMMPYLVRAMCQDVLISPYSVEPFEYVRCPTVAQNPTTGNCGPYTRKFLELLAFGHPFSDLTTIREADMVFYRQKYSVDIYEHGKREAGTVHLV